MPIRRTAKWPPFDTHCKGMFLVWNLCDKEFNALGQCQRAITYYATKTAQSEQTHPYVYFLVHTFGLIADPNASAP